MTILKTYSILILEHLFAYGKGIGMSTHELELFNIIYENDNPEQAVLTAIKTFAAFLEQLEEDPEPPAVCQLESA